MLKKRIQTEKLIFASRLGLFLAGLLGLSLQLIKNGGFNMLLYYTILSNILVTAFVGYLVYLMWKKERLYQTNSFLRAKMGVTMAILITFVIYHAMLRPYVFPEQFWRLENFLCHYIVPLWFLLDGLLIDGRIAFYKLDPFRWTLAPLAYSAFALFNGTVTKFAVPGSPDSPYPYFFLNLDKNGWAGVLLSSLFLSGFYILGGYGLIALKLAISCLQDRFIRKA